jgi:hypothetical protein
MASKTSCWELVESCLDQSRNRPDTYTLATPRGRPWISTQSNCFQDSVWIVENLGPVPMRGQSNSATTTTAAATPTAAPVPTAPAARADGPFVPDGRTRFAKSFFDAGNFKLNATGNQVSKKIDLPFLYDNSVKGMEITVTYTVRKLACNRYSIEYEIADQKGNVVGAKRTIEFSTTGNQIDQKLGFGVELYNEGNFGQVKWMGIVRL